MHAMFKHINKNHVNFSRGPFWPICIIFSRTEKCTFTVVKYFDWYWYNVPVYGDCKFLHLVCSLPAAVQFALFSELTRKRPLRGVPLANEGSDVVMAHVIYNQWVIRFVQQYVKYSGPPPRPPISATVEVTCSPPVQIINIVRQLWCTLNREYFVSKIFLCNNFLC